MAAPEYDVIVFGATGYTGKLTAYHIAEALPTDLKWALAGRSKEKLEVVAAECKNLNADRIQPAIEIANLNDEDLSALSKKTKILISTVGPYALYGEHAFKACAENGTHYLDVTGEVAFVSKMIKKYEKTAEASGAWMFPQIGVDSAPADLTTWTLVTMIKEKLSVKTAEVVCSLYDLTGSPSGGTIATVLNLMDSFSMQELAAANKPYALSPVPGPKTPNPSPWYTSLFGFRAVSDLGVLTTSFGGLADTPIVQRSWGLLGGNDFYGPNFYFTEFMKARNHLTAILFHFAILVGSMALAIGPLRRLARGYVTQPGGGDALEDANRARIEYRAIGIPDLKGTKTKAFVRASFERSPYVLTGVFLAEAVRTILKDQHDLSGGVYTPACLGQKFIDRLDDAGFKFERKFYDN